MSKEIRYGEQARKEIFHGIETVANTVMVTMWPKGRNVILGKEFGNPVVTNDGVTVAKEIELQDKYHNIGASLVKEAANKTNDAAGDGTTTTTVLTYSIAKEGQRYIKAGVNPFALGRGLHKAVDRLVQHLGEHSKSVNAKDEIRQVAALSAQDEEVGALIADIMDEVGQDGVITVEEGKSLGLEKDVVQGMQFDQGYLSPYFVSDTQRMESVIENPHILITDAKISSMKSILNIIESAAASGKKDFVIIADDVEGEALTSLVLNKMRGVINVLAIKAPGFGDRKKALLQDIATVTGAQLVTQELGLKIEEVGMEVLGQAKKVVTTKDKTTIIDGAGDTQQVADRVGQIKAQIANTSSDYDRDKLAERVAKLAGGVAVIRVGAATEMEMKNRKYKIEDALNATRAAVAEGILPGGGTSLVKLAKKLENIDTTDADELAGIDIVRNAILYPVTQIADNAGYKGDRVVEEVKKSDDFNHGFNASSGEFEDLMEQGIIDPTKVIRVALQNAVSAAAMFLTTDAVVADLPKSDDDKSSGGGAPAGGMWGMWGMGGMPGMF